MMMLMMIASVLLLMHKFLSRDTAKPTSSTTLLSRPWSRHDPIGMMKRMMNTIVV